MLHREITYIDGNGVKTTDKFYFNLNELEIFEINLEYEESGGIMGVFKKATETGSQKDLFALIKRILLASYGLKDEDGRGFTKTEALTNKFSQSFAFVALFKELGTSDDAAANFIKGVLPQDMSPELDKAILQQKIVNLPPGPLPTKE